MADPAYFTSYNDGSTMTRRVEAHNLRPEQAFSVEFLRAGYPFIEWDGERIVLNLSNGRWVYVVAKRLDGGRLVIGRWPD